MHGQRRFPKICIEAPFLPCRKLSYSAEILLLVGRPPDFRDDRDDDASLLYMQ
jgi:hypothetical protein